MTEWERRDGSRIDMHAMSDHHAWNAARMSRRNGHRVHPILALRAGRVRGLRLVYFHAWNVVWLLTHPTKINRSTLRGL